MRYLVYLLTLFFISSAVAQTPTIVQGDYITNVFGQSNFVLNPNAQINTGNVTNATRSTTTPLVAKTEFTLSLASGANATWTLRAFDQGMKGQNCEARFTYRGFATATTKAELVQNSLVVASLTLTPTTDPRIASINFPCGDLVNATTFRIAQTTANMTGTNEIGGIYTGLATNMANVAQAELYGGLQTSTLYARVVGSAAVWTDFSYVSGTVSAINKASSVANTLSVTFNNLPAGDYQVVYNQPMFMYGGSGGHSCKIGILETTSGTRQLVAESGTLGAGIGQYASIPAFAAANFSFATSGSRTFKIQANNNGWTTSANGDCYTESSLNGGIYVYRFPSSSELVVTPERQNVFGGIRSDLTSGSFSTSSTTNTQITGLGNFSTVGNATSVGSMQFTMPIVPVGTYKLDFFVLAEAVPAASNQRTDCLFTIYDGTTSLTSAYLSSSREGSPTDTPVQGGVFGSAVVKYSSIQTNKQFTVQVRRSAGAGGTCNAYGNGIYSSYFTITPLDQPSNSALYVEGPVKAAATGAAIPAGYAGETKTYSFADAVFSTSSPVIGTYYNTGDLITNLLPGVYLFTTDSVYVETQGAITKVQVRFQDASNNAFSSCGVAGGLTNAFVGLSCVVNITSTTTLRLGYRISTLLSGTATQLALRYDYNNGGQKITATRLN